MTEWINEYFWVGTTAAFAVLSFFNAWQNHRLLQMLKQSGELMVSMQGLISTSRPTIEGLMKDLKECEERSEANFDAAASFHLLLFLYLELAGLAPKLRREDD